MRYDEDEIFPIDRPHNSSCFICFHYKTCNHIVDLMLATPYVCDDCVLIIKSRQDKKDWNVEGF